MRWIRPTGKLDRDREAAIEHQCIRAQVEAEMAGEAVTAVICAGPPCPGDMPGCAWCTRVEVQPDGSRARTDAAFV
jgi:hypothetical protein